MNQAEFGAAIIGKRIVGVTFRTKDDFHKAILFDELSIQTIHLEDRTDINFSASGQVEITEVWVELSQRGR